MREHNRALNAICVMDLEAGRKAARAALEPLRLAFLFDAVESGDKIVFRKRARSITSTLPTADIGAGDGQADAAVMEHERGQEAELPTQLSLAYKSLQFDYQTQVQVAQRRVGDSDQQASVQVPVVLTDTQAKRAAEVLLYSQWIGRNKRTVRTWRKWSAVEPTDVIEVDDGDV